jgi:hypothetical protein
VQLHGNMLVAAIRKKHALEYRQALQDVPRLREGKLLRVTLPVQAAWGREHPEEPRSRRQPSTSNWVAFSLSASGRTITVLCPMTFNGLTRSAS